MSVGDGRERRHTTAVSTADRPAFRRRRPCPPPARSTSAYTVEASQLCTTHGSPAVVNV
jgi:hypothetical protein